MKKILIEVLDEDTGEVLLKDDFSSVEAMQEKLYKIEHVMNVPDEDIMPTNDDHDCHLVGGHGDESCDHPSHKESANMEDTEDLGETYN